MSTGRECSFVEYRPGEWFLVLERGDSPREGLWLDYAEAYGPFASQGDAAEYLREHFADPGATATQEYGQTLAPELVRVIEEARGAVRESSVEMPVVELRVFVPRRGALVDAAPRSAIVAAPEQPYEDGVLCYLEGWVHGAMQYESFDARGRWEAGVLHAADRAVNRAPTVAKRLVDRDDLVEVGVFVVASRTVRVSDEATLTAWLR